MRTGTDEMGWRYNGVFKKHGWSSKAGPGGWGGWVRRREWVRLRCVRPQIRERGDEKDGDEEIGKTGEANGRSLKEVISDKQEDGVWAIVKELETVSLDREKLQIWERWLEGADDDTRKRLQGVLDDPDSVSRPTAFYTWASSK